MPLFTKQTTATRLRDHDGTAVLAVCVPSQRWTTWQLLGSHEEVTNFGPESQLDKVESNGCGI